MSDVSCGHVPILNGQVQRRPVAAPFFCASSLCANGIGVCDKQRRNSVCLKQGFKLFFLLFMQLKTWRSEVLGAVSSELEMEGEKNTYCSQIGLTVHQP